jgi:hypothetical protein
MKNHVKDCKGYNHVFLHPTLAIARILRVKQEGREALLPVLHGSLAKVVIYDPNCPTCNELAEREIQRRLLLRRFS